MSFRTKAEHCINFVRLSTDSVVEGLPQEQVTSRRNVRQERDISRRAFIRNASLAALTVAVGGHKLVNQAVAQENKSIAIDCHTHLVRKVGPTFGLTAHYTWHEYNGDLLVAEMDRAGIDKALLKSYSSQDLQYVTGKVFPGGIKPGGGGLDTSEEYMVSYARKYPDRLLWMDVFNPKDDDMNEWREKIKD